jgi:hypothetical protein
MQIHSRIVFGLRLLAGCLFVVACAKEGDVKTDGTGGAAAFGGQTGTASGGVRGTSPGAGGTVDGAGGQPSSTGGASAGQGGATGGATGGAGGAGGATICPAIACVMPVCPYGTLPASGPCGCPTCAPPPVDGGADAAADANPGDSIGTDAVGVCSAACVLPTCPNGTSKGPPPCYCPVCAPGDGGAVDTAASDAPVICNTLVACPAIACLDGYLPSPTPCGCPTCAPPDGGAGMDASGVDGPVACIDIVCPMIACVAGFAPSPVPCGCPVCAGTTQ